MAEFVGMVMYNQPWPIRAQCACEQCGELWVGTGQSGTEAWNELERQRVLHICVPPPGVARSGPLSSTGASPSGIWSICGIPTKLSQTVPAVVASRIECEDGIITQLDAMSAADRARHYVALHDGGWRLERAEQIGRDTKHAIDDMLHEALSYLMLHRRYGLTIATARHACEA